MDWAIVIGVDEYGAQEPQLRSAVTDAKAFRKWLLAEFGVDEEEEARSEEEKARIEEVKGRVFTLLGRRSEDEDRIEGERLPTKDNVLGTVNELMVKSGGVGERLFGFFSGHGVTTTFANREESALVFPGVDDSQPETLAVRSIMEFFETTQFRDQFFFIDACRSPLEKRSEEIGLWMIPRRREPGQAPVQQFVLYATSPGRPAESSIWDEELSAFTTVLMGGLEGDGHAKAWSWERNCYEVRWERLATYIHDVMQGKRDEDQFGLPRYPFQIPQDVGVRGVAGRDRDALLARPRGARVERYELMLELDTDLVQDVKIVVTDAIGTEVASALNVTGGSQSFELQPRTYSARAFAANDRVGRLRAPVDLHGPRTGRIDWLENVETQGVRSFEEGMIALRARDPLAVADIRDDTGWVVGVATRKRGCKAPPGFYQVRLVGPERDNAAKEKTVELPGGTKMAVEPPKPTVDERAAELAKALSGSSKGRYVIPVAGAKPAIWAQPSTVVAAAVGAALRDDRSALRGLGLRRQPKVAKGRSRVAFFAVAGDDTTSLAALNVRIWRAGLPVRKRITPLSPSPAGVAAVVKTNDEPRSYWLSVEAPGEKPTVMALPLLKDRLAMIVAQVESGQLRVYQFHPIAQDVDWSTADWMRRVEHLQRRLLGGRLEGADELAKEIALQAKNDPFAGCLAGYVLLRLGLREGLGKLASDIIEVAPALSDAYILRGEYEAYKQDQDASNQAFAEAVSAGVPAFGEGLTRLVEGLRVSGFFHPRGALVRYIFQRHARGNMWAAFTPKNEFKPGRLVITGPDIGYEG